MNIQLLTAVAEQNRMRIIELLRSGPLAVNDISKKLGLRQPQVSKHLKILHDVGFVAVERIGQRRVYCLQDAPFAVLFNWIVLSRSSIEERYMNSLEYFGELKIDR